MRYSHKLLVDEGAKWLLKDAPNILYKSMYVVTEMVFVGGKEIPDIFGIRPQGNVLIEVKVSKTDFKRDRLKRGRDDRLPQLGERRLYLTPKGLLGVDDLPGGWGLLEYHEGKVEIVKKSDWFDDADVKATTHLYYSVIRRTNKSQIFNFEKNGNNNQSMVLVEEAVPVKVPQL